MHLKRQAVKTKLPIKRKGTTYVARALSNPNNSVPLLIAVRDMLKLAKTKRELEKMIIAKQLKINGRVCIDHRESIALFNILEAGKKYSLTILPTGRFALEETKSSDRLCKVTGKKLVSGNRIQLNLHDGTNLLSKDKIDVEDSVYLTSDGKIKKHLSLEKGAKVFIISGKYIGLNGTVSSIEGKNTNVKFKDKEEPAALSASQLIAHD